MSKAIIKILVRAKSSQIKPESIKNKPRVLPQHKGKRLSIAVLVASACSLSACSSGAVLIAGSADGIRAYNDGLNGLVTEGKASPDTKGSYWQNRDLSVQGKMMRFKAQMNK